jgi:hypothetical protein
MFHSVQEITLVEFSRWGSKQVVPYIKFHIMKALCCLLLLSMYLQASAQTTERVTNPDNPIYSDVSGSPYVINTWSDGVIYFTSGRVANQFKIKFDSYKNQVVLQFNGSSFVTESKIRQFTIYTKGARDRDSMVFRKGFPVTNRANEETFYEVLIEGKATLLLLHYKHVTEESEIASKIIRRRIRDEDQHYLLMNGVMSELPSDRQLVPETFPSAQQEALKKYISDESLKFFKSEDFRKLVRYYNSL